jgi:hypothetical protein
MNAERRTQNVEWRIETIAVIEGLNPSTMTPSPLHILRSAFCIHRPLALVSRL